MSLAKFFTGDVAQRDDDQDRDGDAHAYADPDDLLIYAAVALAWNNPRFISKLQITHLSDTLKNGIPFSYNWRIHKYSLCNIKWQIFIEQKVNLWNL